MPYSARMKTINQHRTGLMAGGKGPLFGASAKFDVMTIPAREALEKVADRQDDDAYYFTRPPAGLVVVLAPVPNGQPGQLTYALRCEDEPPFPGEVRDDGMTYWQRAALEPCPICGAALVWYEAGYVPGYRVCAKRPYHHIRMG